MPKLPRNMFKRGRNYYFRGMVGGRRVKRSLGMDYEEARARLRSLKREGVVPIASITVETAVRRWLSSYVPTARGEKNQRLTAQRVRDYLLPYLGHQLLHRLTRDRLRAYRLELEKTDLAVQSIKHVLSDCRCFLNWCEDAGLVDRSPFPRRIMPRIQERPPDRLSDEAVAQVLRVPEPYAFVVRLALGTGLRWGELVRAQATDQRQGLLTVAKTKSGKVRRVPLPPELEAEIRQRIGKLIPFAHSDSFNKCVQRLSGVRGFHVHQLRHTFACRWLEAGGSLAALQEILGHASIVTTQRYGRLGEAHVQAEARRIQGRLAPPVAPAHLR